MNRYTPELPKEVAKKYKLVNWKGGPRQVFGRFGVVDLRTITVKYAEHLVQRGFTKLERIPEVKEEPKPKPAPKPKKKSSKKKDE